MSTSLPPDFNAQVIEEFRTNGGVVGGMFEGMTLLLLHDKGAKSGKTHIHPLAYYGEDGRFFIFGSKGGAPTNPAWYHNLKAHPDVRIEVGPETFDVTATELTGEERERVFRAQAERAPQFAEYAKNTDRAIPVIALTPKQRS
jgi:deazaflavin-dependent oxidoreductase (nitroreductase family)